MFDFYNFGKINKPNNETCELLQITQIKTKQLKVQLLKTSICRIISCQYKILYLFKIISELKNYSFELLLEAINKNKIATILSKLFV